MDLADFIKAIEEQCHTQISVEGIHAAFAESDTLKLAPDQYLHHSAFCRSQKLSDNNRLCSRNKQRSLKIAEYGKSFCGKCPFGVHELAQPVIFEGTLAAVCYFTITETTVSLPVLRKKAAWLAEYIRLILSVCAKKENTGKQNDAKYYRKKCMYFLDLHYAGNIGEDDLAAYLGLNTKYCSALFLKVMGKHFRQALTERRLHEATIYLKLHQSLSISYIACLCGFSDSNYFSSVFRRYYGMSPREYRTGKNEKQQRHNRS